MAYLGMPGTGQFAADQLPEDWEQMIMFQYPNGQTPIFAIQSMFPKQTVKSSTFHWWTEVMPVRTGAVSDIYIDAGLTTAYVYATHHATKGITGATIYVKVAESIAEQVIEGTTVALRDEDRPKVTVRGRVTGTSINGASSYLAVQLIEDDDNDDTPASYNLATVDRVILMAPAYPWGSTTPQGMSYTPTELTNNTQIARDTFDASRTALAEEKRTGNKWENDKIRLMYRHAQGWEWTALFGHKYSTTDPVTKQPLKFTQGMLDFLLTNNSANFIDFRYDSNYSGKKWTEAGHKFIRKYFKLLKRYAADQVFCLVGDSAAEGMEELAETYGQINLDVAERDYGLEVSRWHTFSGSFDFKTHALMSIEDSTARMMVFYIPANLKLAPLVNNGESGVTTFDPEMQVPGTDGKTAGFLSEQGWKFYQPYQWLILDGIGADNLV